MSLPRNRPLVYKISDGTFEPGSANSYQAFADEIRRAAEAGVVGREGLRKAAARVEGFAVIGLGGVDRQNYPEVLAAGAAGFAAIRALKDAEWTREIEREEL